MAENERIVLLNRLISRSVTKSTAGQKAPLHGFEELFGILKGLYDRKDAREFVETQQSGQTDKPTEYVRISDVHKLEKDGFGFATLLLEHVDKQATSFPVVDVTTFAGRELRAEANERGAATAHVCVRYPLAGRFDDCNYRCVVEYVPPISRRLIDILFRRLLRRQCSAEDWSFSVSVLKAGKIEEKTYKYYPKLELATDAKKAFSATVGRSQLSSMVFLKRSTHHSIGEPSTIKTEEEVIDVEYRISAKQGPSDFGEQQTWMRRWIEHFKNRGFESKLYFRTLRGGIVSGSVHADVAGALDLVMSPKESILIGEEPRRWCGAIQEAIERQLHGLLSNDDLWEHGS